MAGVLEMICPTAKGKICPSGYFAAGRSQQQGHGAKRLQDGLSPSKPFTGNCDEVAWDGEGVKS